MVKGIYHSAAGMLARQKHLEVVSNNLANASTVGFKQESLCFRSALESSLAPANISAANDRFVEAELGAPRPEQGTLTQTGNPLDLAIVGAGYFAVETPLGTAYTRDGRFQLNAEGELVTLSGHRVLTEGGTGVVPRGEIKIGPDGSLVIRNPQDGREQVLDALQVVAFADQAQMRRGEEGLLYTQQPPQELPEVHLQVGYLEESTVNMVAEMVKMIEISQYYDASARALQTQDGTLGKAVNEVGKI